MIIRRPGTGRRNATILTAALAPTGDTAAGPQRSLAFGDPGPRTNKRRQLHDRVEVEAAVARLAADGSNLLDDLEDDDGRDPFDLAERFERDFDGLADAAFGSIADPARKATAFRKLAQVRARLMAAAQVMQEETEDRRFADTVFNSAETILARAQKDPEGTADHLERVAGVIDMTDLSDERKEQVATAVAARAITANLEDLLGPKIKKHVPAGRQFLAGLQTVNTEGEVTATADMSRADAPALGEGIVSDSEINPNGTDGDGLGEVIAQNNVPPLASPSPVPEESGSEGAPVQADEDPSDFDVDEAERLIKRITRIVRGDIEPLPDNFRARVFESLRPGIKHRSGLAGAIDRLVIVTQRLSEPRAREIAARAGLDEDTFVLFHDFINATPETQSDVKLRWARRLPVDRSLPRSQWMPVVPMRRRVFNHLEEIAESTPESRDGVVGPAMTRLQTLTLLTLSKSPEQDLQVIKHALDPIR